MLSLFLLQLAAAELASSADNKNSGNSILSYEPKRSAVDGGTDVLIQLSAAYEGNVYCKFDDAIRLGERKSESSFVCISPSHSAGVVQLSVSFDQQKWFGDAEFRYYDGTKAMYIVVGLVVGISIVSFGMFLLQMRQCKDEQMKHKRGAGTPAALNSYANNYDEEGLPMNRKSAYRL